MDVTLFVLVVGAIVVSLAALISRLESGRTARRRNTADPSGYQSVWFADGGSGDCSPADSGGCDGGGDGGGGGD